MHKGMFTNWLNNTYNTHSAENMFSFVQPFYENYTIVFYY